MTTGNPPNSSTVIERLLIFVLLATLVPLMAKYYLTDYAITKAYMEQVRAKQESRQS